MEARPSELDIVRQEVRGILSRSEAWRDLPTEARSSFAKDMVKVGSFLAKDPGWLKSTSDDDMAKAAGAPATALEESAEQGVQRRLAEAPKQVGAEFESGAVTQSVDNFRRLVDTVDFPEFVSGLIQGVFQAIVDASIQQMEAYGELLAATAKSVDQFANDHISDGQAREMVANRFPSIVRIERTSGGGQRLVQREDADDTSALQELTGTTEVIEFEDRESEQKLLTAAKLEMARQRQKMMALMVLLGINRIVVTRGRINAKVVFDIKADDMAERQAEAGMRSDRSSETGAAAAAWAPWGAAGAYHRSAHKTTVTSSVDDKSESSAEMKAKLSGEVRVDFKSETLPPERMLDALQMEQVNFLSQAGGGTPPAGQTPPPAQSGGQS